MATSIKRFASLPWIAEVFALLGGLVYLFQAIKYAALQVSILDEGAYLYKVKNYIEARVERKHVLQGLGEVLSQPQKDWVRDHLVDGLLFELSVRLAAFSK